MIRQEIVSVNIPQLGDDFKRILHKYLTIACEDVSNIIQKSAKESHNYKNRTRNLRNSTSSKVKVVEESYDIKLKVSEVKAPYAKFIINGHGSWQSDPFIDKAFEDNEKYIYSKIEKAVENAVDEFNRS